MDSRGTNSRARVGPWQLNIKSFRFLRLSLWTTIIFLCLASMGFSAASALADWPTGIWIGGGGALVSWLLIFYFGFGELKQFLVEFSAWRHAEISGVDPSVQRVRQQTTQQTREPSTQQMREQTVQQMREQTVQTVQQVQEQTILHRHSIDTVYLELFVAAMQLTDQIVDPRTNRCCHCGALLKGIDEYELEDARYHERWCPYFNEIEQLVAMLVPLSHKRLLIHERRRNPSAAAQSEFDLP
jgi:hypothetical protein